MCELKSGIVLKDRVFMPLDYDSHEDMIKELGLNDKTQTPDFVRVEIKPPDSDFRKPLKDWVYKVDQDFLPEWYSPKFAEKETRDKLVEWHTQRVILEGVIDKIESGRWFLGGGTVNEVLGGGTVNEVWGGTVNEVWDGGTVNEVLGGGTVNEVWGGGTVNEVWDGGTVNEVLGGGTVNKVWGGTVNEVWGGTVNEVLGGTVNEVWGGGTVNEVWGGTVNEVLGGGTVNEVWGGTVKIYSKDAVYKTIKDNGIVILYYKDNPEIIVANKNIKLTVV